MTARRCLLSPIALCSLVGAFLCFADASLNNQWYKGRFLDIMEDSVRPNCGEPCTLKIVWAVSAVSCGKICVDTEGCKSAIHRVEDGYCSLKKYRMWGPEMDIVPDPLKAHKGIRNLSRIPYYGGAGGPPLPAVKAPPVPLPENWVEGGSCNDPNVQLMLSLHNKLRRETNLPEFTCNEDLSKVGLQWSQDMCRMQLFDHNDEVHNNTYVKRMNSAGYYNYIMENIAARGLDPNHVTNIFGQWFNSQGHHDTITNSFLKMVGFGYTSCVWWGGGNYVVWTAEFACAKWFDVTCVDQSGMGRKLLAVTFLPDPV